MNRKIILTLIISLISIHGLLAVGDFDKNLEKNCAATIDSKTKAVVINSINRLLIEQYVFPDVAEQMKAHLNTKLKNGDYDKINNPVRFAKTLEEDLHKISKDNHFFMEFNPERAELLKAKESQSKEEVEKANKKLFEDARWNNFGLKKLEILRGNIGYLHISFFANPEYGGATAVASMNFLANSDAVIIDLRNTPGGWPTMVQLICSYFIKGTDTEGRTYLNSFERRFNNSLEQFWTISYVPGKRMYDTDLYILTNRYTSSGAEEFTYNMKNLKRATIIGETTSGSAHNVEYKVIQDCFVMHLPTGKPINPISGTNWERTGIEPDIKVKAENALEKTYLLTLEKSLKKTKDENRLFQINWAMDGLRARLNQVEVDERILKKYAGDYGERKVQFENGELFYQRTGPKYKLIPLKETLFALEGLDFFRIEFVLDAAGNVTELIGLYEIGFKDSSKRNK
jgi:hypothetical protein